MIPDDVLRQALSAMTGEKEVLAKDLRYDLRSPCADCPFLKTSEYHEGVAKHIPGYVAELQNNNFGHTCHKTDTRTGCDGPVRGKETSKPIQHCVGALMMILKTGRGFDLQLPLLEAMEDGRISGEEVTAMTARAKKDKRIFTVPQLINFYGEGDV